MLDSPTCIAINKHFSLRKNVDTQNSKATTKIPGWKCQKIWHQKCDYLYHIQTPYHKPCHKSERPSKIKSKYASRRNVFRLGMSCVRLRPQPEEYLYHGILLRKNTLTERVFPSFFPNILHWSDWDTAGWAWQKVRALWQFVALVTRNILKLNVSKNAVKPKLLSRRQFYAVMVLNPSRLTLGFKKRKLNDLNLHFKTTKRCSKCEMEWIIIFNRRTMKRIYYILWIF